MSHTWLRLQNMGCLTIFSTLKIGRGLSTISRPSLPITLKIFFWSCRHSVLLTLTLRSHLQIDGHDMPVYLIKERRAFIDMRLMMFNFVFLPNCFRALSYLVDLIFTDKALAASLVHFVLFLWGFLPVRKMSSFSTVDCSVECWNVTSFESLYLSSLKGGCRSSRPGISTSSFALKGLPVRGRPDLGRTSVVGIGSGLY